MYHYWSLPEAQQKLVASLVPKKDSWTLNLIKAPDGVWLFSIALIKDEALCGGTEKVIDFYYKKLMGEDAEAGSKIKMIVSSVDSGSYTTKLTDPTPSSDGLMNGTVYTDSNSKMECWLCPVLQVMFGEQVPIKLFITFSEDE